MCPRPDKEIFIEDLGWHVEETAGDRVYEWVAPDLTFYTYKITATDSDKYYYGVSHVKKANATVEDCLAHEYYGSGGALSTNKFRQWRAKHKNFLIKEILSIHRLQAEAYAAETKLIGDRYRTDRKCLNSTIGGKNGGLERQRKLRETFTTRTCPIHGEAKHQGSYCCTCVSRARYS